MTPCGFAFVVYYTREDAEDAVKYINGTVLDDRPVRADFDWGFKEGRQFGRGRSGGQARPRWTRSKYGLYLWGTSLASGKQVSDLLCLAGPWPRAGFEALADSPN